MTRPSVPKTKPAAATDDLHAEERRWFAVRTGPRKEKVVARQLAKRGIEHFLPLRDKPFEYVRKRGVRQLPLLAGYIFVRVRRAEYVPVVSVPFVYDFVRSGRRHRRVTEAEMDVLRRISTDQSVSWAEVAREELSAGQPVEIASGPLAGVRGYFLNKKTTKTFVITFGGLDARLATCEVDPRNLIPLDGEPLAGAAAGGGGDAATRSALW